MDNGREFKPISLDLNEFTGASSGGLGPAVAGTTSSHPLEDIDYKHLLKEEVEKSQRLRKAFGFQQAMKNSVELNMCAKSARLPGLRSSMLSVEVLMDKLDSLQQYEYMNVEKPRNEFGVEGLHSILEKEFRI